MISRRQWNGKQKESVYYLTISIVFLIMLKHPSEVQFDLRSVCKHVPHMCNCAVVEEEALCGNVRLDVKVRYYSIAAEA